MWPGIAHICNCFYFVFSYFTKELLNIWGFYIKPYWCFCSLTNVCVHHAVITRLWSSMRWGGLQWYNVNTVFHQNWSGSFPICNMHADQTSPVCVYVMHTMQRTCTKLLFLSVGMYLCNLQNEDLSLLWFDTLPLGQHFLMFWRNTPPAVPPIVHDNFVQKTIATFLL